MWTCACIIMIFAALDLFIKCFSYGSVDEYAYIFEVYDYISLQCISQRRCILKWSHTLQMYMKLNMLFAWISSDVSIVTCVTSTFTNYNFGICLHECTHVHALQCIAANVIACTLHSTRRLHTHVLTGHHLTHHHDTPPTNQYHRQPISHQHMALDDGKHPHLHRCHHL